MAIDIKEILANGLLDLCHKKDLSQITVKDLLETTGVSRQTFYNHFLDKNDLIQYIYNHKIINRFNGQNTNLDFYESLIESFEHETISNLFKTGLLNGWTKLFKGIHS